MNITMKPFARIMLPCAALLLMLSGTTWAEEKKPNILVIWGDDVGQQNISAYHRGMMGGSTPNIDRIANEGAIFTDSYAQQSCTAGRASFILGQHPFRTGLLTIGMPGAKQGIQDKDPTIAELLKNHGYVSGQFGKNHLGDRDEHLPTAHGFDEFFGNLYHLNAEEEPESEFYPKDPEFHKKFGPRGVLHTYADGRIEDTGPLTRKRMETADNEFLDASINFIETAHKEGKPFFVWHNSTRMHVWTHLSDKYKGKSGYGMYADGMMELDDGVGDLDAGSSRDRRSSNGGSDDRDGVVHRHDIAIEVARQVAVARGRLRLVEFDNDVLQREECRRVGEVALHVDEAGPTATARVTEVSIEQIHASDEVAVFGEEVAEGELRVDLGEPDHAPDRQEHGHRDGDNSPTGEEVHDIAGGLEAVAGTFDDGAGRAPRSGSSGVHATGPADRHPHEQRDEDEEGDDPDDRLDHAEGHGHAGEERHHDEAELVAKHQSAIQRRITQHLLNREEPPRGDDAQHHEPDHQCDRGTDPELHDGLNSGHAVGDERCGRRGNGKKQSRQDEPEAS